ncbi:UbiA prenyltransferase family-domain-containing protein [Lentinula edodes]|uniref:UbiA prenyltransferase family-domain-containing protein n=1 Tax=Lentinula edodes TaxID=5353 RepID=UPI001E8CD8BE|nr:UbiA prenyltransferase family-domain-containing protein [Lentinula edodes]KAH7874998.1 UbiA prenyltransferase family-domain-containing protein [Lentinula edodes]
MSTISLRKSQVLSLFSWPTVDEVQACWELCRLHNNIGFWTIWLPTAWSIAMAYNAQPDLSGYKAICCGASYIPLCFGMKSMIMTIDDLLDHDIDKLVSRTKNRPLPRGAITQQRAWLFFSVQLFVVLLMFISMKSRELHLVLIVCPLYFIYPTCKRWMSFAPIPLGMMFNIGTLIGWNSVSIGDGVPWNKLLPVYGGSILWTIAYETIYQHQDKIDDARIGIHSPALLLGSLTLPVCLCASTLFIGLLCYGGYGNNQGPVFFCGIFIAGMVLLPKIAQTDIDNPEECKGMFLQTPIVGQIILAAFILDAVGRRITTNTPL